MCSQWIWKDLSEPAWVSPGFASSLRASAGSLKLATGSLWSLAGWMMRTRLLCESPEIEDHPLSLSMLVTQSLLADMAHD
jgi:hypothetical protein